MKKIFIALAPAIIAVIAYGCSKDHDAPTFGKFESLLKSPENLVATYERSNDEFTLQWEMPDTNSVKMYFVAWSDSNVFDLGRTADEFTNSIENGYKLDAIRVLQTMGYTTNTAQIDSFIVYFTVSALYFNDSFNEFIGPRSVVDSALVYKK